LFREAIGAHTCDRRSSKTFIAARYPAWNFEEGFKEEDPLWKANERESDNAMDERSKAILDDVFEHDKKTWISISSHSGEIGSLLRGMLLQLPFTFMGLVDGEDADSGQCWAIENLV
jgi:hypothetical protein